VRKVWLGVVEKKVAKKAGRKRKAKRKSKKTPPVAVKRSVGRPRKDVTCVNPHVTVGRHPQEEIDVINRAVELSGARDRSSWAWPIMWHEALKVLKEHGEA